MNRYDGNRCLKAGLQVLWWLYAQIGSTTIGVYSLGGRGFLEAFWNYQSIRLKIKKRQRIILKWISGARSWDAIDKVVGFILQVKKQHTLSHIESPYRLLALLDLSTMN